MKDVERSAILAAYQAVGTVKAAANLLGISQRTVHYRLGEYRRQGLVPTKSSSRPPRQGAQGCVCTADQSA